MFSENNKISKRQMFRLLTYDLLGIGTLALPPALAGITEKNGMIAILFGILAGLCYCALIGWLLRSMEDGESYPVYLKRTFGKIFGTVMLLFYALYYLCLGGYAAYVFGHLMITELLKEQSFYFITAGIVLLCVYGITQGIEGRARIYEILFWFLMTPLFLMLFLAARDVELPRLFPLYTQSFEGGFLGAYYSFLVFSIGGMALFLAPFAKKKESVRGACMGAVLFSGIILLVLYGILQGIFGTAALGTLTYPAVTLMSMIQIPGGFMERQDAFMVAVWFFTIFALMGSSMFYASQNLREITAGKLEKIWIAFAAVVLFLIAVWSYRSVDFTKILERAFLLFATPLVVLIPLVAGCVTRMRNTEKTSKGHKPSGGGKAIGCLLLVCFSFFLSGCSTAELENREFPLAMGINQTEDTCQISFKFQNLSAIADENADSPGGTDFFIEDKDFFTAVSKYANYTNKRMDYNHMKTLILSKSFLEDADSLSHFLEVCSTENLLARNTLLFLAEDAAEILKLDENLDDAIGSYLEEMIESREDYRLKDTVTLGDLFNEMENKEQLLLIPVLKDEGGIPVICDYYAIAGGELKGEVSLNAAVFSYLSQGKLRKLSFTLEDQTAVTIDGIFVKGEFAGGDGVLYRNCIRLEAAVEKRMAQAGGEESAYQKEIEELILGQLQAAAQDLQSTIQVDLTNSFYKRGMGGEKLYERYKGDFLGYARDLRYAFEVEVVLVSI